MSKKAAIAIATIGIMFGVLACQSAPAVHQLTEPTIIYQTLTADARTRVASSTPTPMPTATMPIPTPTLHLVKNLWGEMVTPTPDPMRNYRRYDASIVFADGSQYDCIDFQQLWISWIRDCDPNVCWWRFPYMLADLGMSLRCSIPPEDLPIQQEHVEEAYGICRSIVPMDRYMRVVGYHEELRGAYKVGW